MILNGWKEIANYLGRGVRTVQRWEGFGLPVRRPVGGLRSSVITTTEDIDRWIRAFRRNAGGNGQSAEPADEMGLHSLIDKVQLGRKAQRELRTQQHHLMKMLLAEREACVSTTQQILEKIDSPRNRRRSKAQRA